MPWFFHTYNFSRQLPIQFFPTLTVLVGWSMIWKGLVLYRAARNEQKSWFIAFLILQTVGILEIMYLLFFSTPRVLPKKKS